MSVKIRLSRYGKKHAPFYRIIAIDSRKKRDGRAIEILGTYNPLSGNIVQYDKEAIDSWVAKGAVVTDAVKKIQKLNKEEAKA